MRKSDYDTWEGYEDGHMRAKTVGGKRVELFYGTQRGGMICIWAKKEDDMNIYQVSDDGEYECIEEAHCMDWDNAVWEYKNLNTADDILDLRVRNS